MCGRRWRRPWPIDGPVVMDFRVAEEENCFPMVPAGGSNSDDAGSEGMDRVMRRSSEQQHTLSVLVENRPGVLSRVAGMFSRRGFNIDSIIVGADGGSGATPA